MATCSPKPRSGKQQTFERIRLNFKKLADREKKHCYLGTDDKCKEAAKAIFQDLRELTESESELETVLNFNVTIRKDLEKLKNEEIRARELEASISSLRNQRRVDKDEIQTLKSELEKLKRTTDKLKDENKRLSTMEEETSKTINKLEVELREARKELEDEKKSLKETTDLQREEATREINRLQMQVKRLDGEQESLTKSAKLQRENDNKEIQRLESEIQELKDVNTSLTKTAKLQKDNDTKEIQRLEFEMKELKDLNTRNEKQLKEKEIANARLENNERKLNKNLRYNEDMVNQLSAQIQALVYENKQVKTHLEMQRNSIDKLQKSLSEEKKAKEHALNRLSAAAAHRLRDQNPGITDLSDPNRPLKLAEKVSELYDNEWTNAMENLEKLDIQEEKGITILLKIIKNVFDTCMEFGDKHLESFPDLLVLPPVIFGLQKQRVLSVTGMSSEMLKPMKDYRKSNAVYAISRLQKYFATERKLHVNQNIYDSCKEYIEKCVELCWMMRIQDPPIYMEADYQTNSAFDSNKMRSYTKAGKFVHFVVWPTFFLHKNGPLLAKGVVQGSKLEIAGDELIYLRADDTDDDDEKFVDANENKSDDVSGDKKSNGENADKLTIDTNKTSIENECIEVDDNSPDDNKHNPGNGEPTSHNSNSRIETNFPETDGNGKNGDVPEEAESNPEEDKPPNDNSNSSSSNKCSDDISYGEDDDVPDGKKSDLDNGMQSNTYIGTKSSDTEDKKEDIFRTSDEKGAESNKEAADDRTFTDDQEIDS